MAFTGIAPPGSNPVRQDREVYFIRGEMTGLIKIGVSDYAQVRLATALQPASPDTLECLGVVVCNNYGKLEKELHKRFARLRAHGEWFRPGEDLLDYIAAHAGPSRPRPAHEPWKDDAAEDRRRQRAAMDPAERGRLMGRKLRLDREAREAAKGIA